MVGWAGVNRLGFWFGQHAAVVRLLSGRQCHHRISTGSGAGADRDDGLVSLNLRPDSTGPAPLPSTTMTETIGPLRVTGKKGWLTVRWRSEGEPPVLTNPEENLARAGFVVTTMTRYGVAHLVAVAVAVIGGAALVAVGHQGWGWAVVGLGVVLTVMAALFLSIGSGARVWRRGRWLPLDPEDSAAFAVAFADVQVQLGPTATADQQEDAAARLWRHAVDLDRSRRSACAIPQTGAR